MAAITSTINEHVYIKIFDVFLFPSIENCFVEYEVFHERVDVQCKCNTQLESFFTHKWFSLTNCYFFL